MHCTCDQNQRRNLSFTQPHQMSASTNRLNSLHCNGQQTQQNMTPWRYCSFNKNPCQCSCNCSTHNFWTPNSYRHSQNHINNFDCPRYSQNCASVVLNNIEQNQQQIEQEIVMPCVPSPQLSASPVPAPPPLPPPVRGGGGCSRCRFNSTATPTTTPRHEHLHSGNGNGNGNGIQQNTNCGMTTNSYTGKRKLTLDLLYNN